MKTTFENLTVNDNLPTETSPGKVGDVWITINKNITTLFRIHLKKNQVDGNIKEM